MYKKFASVAKNIYLCSRKEGHWPVKMQDGGIAQLVRASDS